MQWMEPRSVSELERRVRSESGNSIHVLLEAEDYASALTLHSRWTKKRAWTTVVAALAGLALMATFNRWLLVAGGGIVGGAVGGAIAYEAARRLVLPRRSRKLFAQQKNLRRPVEFSWDAHGLAYISANGSGNTPWTDYVKWRENERMLLLYHSDALFQMLPKRAFSNDDQLHSLLAELAREGSAAR